MQYLHGSAETGVSRLWFKIRPPYCGMLCISFEKIWVYDYLALFSASRLLSKKIRIAVFPPGQPLCMEIPLHTDRESALGQDEIIWQTGDARDEIRQMHTYRAGDFYRAIHWNISARTDQIWVREYEAERDIGMDILIELSGVHEADPIRLDAFYRLLSAVVLGLLQNADTVRAHWYDGSLKRITKMDIQDDRQCQELLYKLYCLDYREVKDLQKTVLQESDMFSHSQYFMLDLQLRWYWKQTIIYHFSESNLTEETASSVFTADFISRE